MSTVPLLEDIDLVESQKQQQGQKQQPVIFLPFIRQQRVVFVTALVVMAVAATTRDFQYHDLREDILTGTIIFMIGDWLAQLLTHWKTVERDCMSAWKCLSIFQVDDNRFVINTILGSIWAGIVNPAIYATVDDFLPGVSLKLVIVKMCMTVSVLSTWGNYTTMFFRRFVKAFWESEDKLYEYRKIFRECINSCNRDFFHVLKDDLKIFPIYDVTCFSVIPPPYRPLTNALICVGWAMYMSIASAKTFTKKNKKDKEKQKLLQESASDAAAIGKSIANKSNTSIKDILEVQRRKNATLEASVKDILEGE
ncbi:hypothetical protein CTEN210_15056 [Chaetoceros tenuissimus]|uniref:Uncharacterized protein n=1 Tax=Chaetoceros tenuissimus TaxID=426638 RepID=A0AAD3HCI6_9STRA|nr:hypothetical protein CTEN210_15056 [Chaetoceros tenuissimus]